MGFIKESDGVDIIINGKPLTEKEKRAISEFIKADRAKITKQKTNKASVTTRAKAALV
jgi:hypothetical protein